ncbi:MAG: substrate-binding domain-containing protein [Acidiferrobacterales bacterium]|nr:substrate-binding domain-containing protein [Acidiferrobacterales bacterium]
MVHLASNLRGYLTVLAVMLGSFPMAVQADERDYISIVGSSTVYPFATVVAERFGTGTEYPTPIIESTGSGGGLKLFCTGIGVKHPDITNSSRRIKQSEVDRCAKSGITGIVEVKFGYDGIVIANSVEAEPFVLTRREIFLALAKHVPSPDDSETLVTNPYKTWKDVNPELPDAAIRVLGPPPTSGTRDAFAELALEGGCETFEWIKAIEISDKKRYKSICHAVREDGAWVEAGENDNIIVQKLNADKQSLGVFGFSFLDQNSDLVQGAVIDGVAPEFENIADGSYAISRSLYFYVKSAHINLIPGIKDYVAEFTNERAWGDDGYLVDKGMIPMPEAERSEFKTAAKELRSVKLASH